MRRTPTPDDPSDPTPSEDILLAQLHTLQRKLEHTYSERRRLEAENAQSAQHIAALEAELAEARAHLHAIMASRSWRLTAPLRRLLRRGA